MLARRSPVQSSMFSLTNFVCSCVRQNIEKISLPRSLVAKLVMPVFGQGKCVRCFYVARENLTSVQEILLWFWQTKGGLECRAHASNKTCEEKLVKENLLTVHTRR